MSFCKMVFGYVTEKDERANWCSAVSVTQPCPCLCLRSVGVMAWVDNCSICLATISDFQIVLFDWSFNLNFKISI